jgi:hypothetical protein
MRAQTNDRTGGARPFQNRFRSDTESLRATGREACRTELPRPPVLITPLIAEGEGTKAALPRQRPIPAIFHSERVGSVEFCKL